MVYGDYVIFPVFPDTQRLPVGQVGMAHGGNQVVDRLPEVCSIIRDSCLMDYRSILGNSTSLAAVTRSAK